WSTGPSMITCRQSPVAAAVGGKLYVVGGWAGPSGSGQCQTANASGTIAVNEVFDPATNMWTSKAAMPTARNHASIPVLNGQLYVVGGGNDTVGALATSESYDPATDQWTTQPSLPTALAGAGSTTIGGSIYLAGGSTLTGAVATVEVYTPG